MKLIALLILLVALQGIWAQQDDTHIVQTSVKRDIDLTTQFAAHTVNITLKNQGEKDVTKFLVAIREENLKHLSILEAYQDGKALSFAGPSPVRETREQRFAIYTVELEAPLQPKKSVDVSLFKVYTHTLIPRPSHITQSESQLVQYFDGHFFFSPYLTKTQTTTVKVPTARIESHSELAPSKVERNAITYGPYTDIRAYFFSKLSVHFESNAPLLTITNLVKEIEVSHWGNIAVEETFDVVHSGAKLKGPFSRYDFQRQVGAAQAIQQYTVVLPPGASDVYYRDVIGNISTSNLNYGSNAITFDIRPRFPLLGGWKTNYYSGYSLPLENGLSTNSDGRFVLNMQFSVDIDATIDRLHVRVILPEGARDIDVTLPFPIEKQGNDVHYTYLDTVGRPVVVLEKSNLIKLHNQYFQVTYSFSTLSLLREPLLLIFGFFFVLLLVMIYARLDLSVSKKQESYVSRELVREYVRKLLDVANARKDTHGEFNQIIAYYLSAKDKKNYELKKVAAESKAKDLLQEGNKYENALKKLDQYAVSKANIINTRQRYQSERIDELHAIEIEHSTGRLKKSEYAASKEKLQSEIAKAEDEIDQAIEDLSEL